MSFLGGLFQSFGRLLPGYMQGERQAVQDNWTDLNQYNKAQAGQLQNMFDENAMRDRLQILKDNAITGNFQRHAAGQDLKGKGRHNQRRKRNLPKFQLIHHNHLK